MRKAITLLSVIIGFICLVQTSCFLVSTPAVSIEGSSTLYPLSVAVTEEYQRGKENARIAVGFSGTGGGIRRFIEGETDIADASRPITPEEKRLALDRNLDFIELPVAYDGIVIAVNSDNTWCDSLTVSELKRIWDTDSQNRLQLWSQVRPDWPEKRIFLFGPGTDSGTLHYFSSSIIGEAKSIRGDISSNEDDNLTVLALRNNPLGMGFFGLSYYEKNQDRLRLVAVDDENPGNGKGPVKPGVSSIMDGTYQPLSRPLFLYVRRDIPEGGELDDFLTFYLGNVSRLAPDVGLVPLPDRLYELVKERFERRISGSMYEGLESGFGISVAELLENKEGKQ